MHDYHFTFSYVAACFYVEEIKNFQVCTCALVAVQSIAVLGRPQDSPAPEGAQAQGSSTPIPIVSQTEVVGPDGSFNYRFVTCKHENTFFTVRGQIIITFRIFTS